MAFKTIFSADGYFSIAQILAIQELAKKSFRKFGFDEFRSGEIESAELKIKGPLTKDMSFEGLDITNVSVFADMPSGKGALGLAKAALESAGEVLGAKEFFNVSCQFNVKDFPNAALPDEVGGEIRQGKARFSYQMWAARGFPDGAASYLKTLCSSIDVPVNFEVKSNVLYQTHRDDLYLYAKGFENSKTIRCEISGASAVDLTRRIDDVINKFGISEKIDCSWTTGTLEPRPPEETRAFLNDLLARNLPARKTVFVFFYVLKDLEGLDTLRKLGGKLELGAALCGFGLPDDERGIISIETTAKGHRLEFSFTNPDCAKEVKKALGLKLALVPI